MRLNSLSRVSKFAIHNGKEHVSKALHDREIAEYLLEKNLFPDWVITCSFYFVLHCVDSYAHKLGIRSFDPAPDENKSAHRKRELFVQKNLKDYFFWYMKLKDRSSQARYDPTYFQLIKPGYPKELFDKTKCFLKIK